MEPVKKTIDGVDFIFRPIDVFESFRDLTSLQKTVVPGLVELMIGGGDGEAMAKAAEKISSQLCPAEFDLICELLLFKHGNIAFSENGMETQRLTKDNKGMAFKSMSGIVEAGMEVAKLSYRDFFSTALSRFGGARNIQQAQKR